MDDLLFSLNATLPIFVMMMLGYFLRRLGLVTQEFADAANTFVFKICLPLVLFDDLYQMDIAAAWDGGFVAFCAAATLGSIALCWPVPIYNVSAVVILELMRPGKVDRGVSPELIRSTIKGIVTNPIILGIVAGVAWSLLRIPMPQVLGTAVADVGGIATPLGLIALGASFSFRRAFAVGTPSIVASAIKLVGLELVFLPLALAAGYTSQKLVAVMMMLGLPSTVSGYVMARNMGYEGAVNSSVVMLTTLLSSVTITFWLWLLKSQGLV